jgi:hypothetical protein
MDCPKVARAAKNYSRLHSPFVKLNLWPGEGKSPGLKGLSNATGFMVGSVKPIQPNLGSTMAATLQQTFAKIRGATKI